MNTFQRPLVPHATSSSAASAATLHAASAAATAERPEWSSRQLFGDRNEIAINHGGSIYRMRITSLGKLILTK